MDDPRRLNESVSAAGRRLDETTADNPLVISDPDTSEHQKRQVIENVKTHIREHMDCHLSLNKVAAVLDFSPSYLSRIFPKYAGEGFVEYATAVRIEAAKELPREGRGRVYEIAEQLGFENAFYFSKVFKKAVGVSPREYARNFARGQPKNRQTEVKGGKDALA